MEAETADRLRVFVRAGSPRARPALVRWYALAGGSPSRVAAERGVPLSTLHSWRARLYPDLEEFWRDVSAAIGDASAP